MEPLRLGVLASHGGTTLQAVMDACDAGLLNARVVVVISNNRQSGAMQRARRCTIASTHLSNKTHPIPCALDSTIAQTLQQHQVNLVLLAGYMKKLGKQTLNRFQGRILNTHPALLPKFGGQGMYGSRVHAAVLAAGETVTGISVHLVDADYDTGPVIAQCKVPLVSGDTTESLANRVQARERTFLVETLRSIAAGDLQLPT